MEQPVVKHIEVIGKDTEEVINDFLNKINGKRLSKTEFIYNNENWWIDYHDWQHSNDILIEEQEALKHDKFLLVKFGSNKTVIYGYCDKKLLMSVPARDIYRIGKRHYVVIDTNVSDLSCFNLSDEKYILKKEFIINAQEAENLGHSEMISGILSGLHSFAKKAGLYFKDTNLKDEGILGDKKFKIYVRDIFSDEDMLIPDEFYLTHTDIDYYILCKIKAGQYKYWGYTTKEVVADTRVVSMTGNIDMDSVGEKIRRIFAEQYLNLSNLIKIYEEEKKEEIIIVPQNYIPLHVHGEFSIGDGYGTANYITDCLKQQGFKACALTDHGSLAGVWDFQKQCLLKDIKPIIGEEFYMSYGETNEDEEDLKIKRRRYHIIVLVKNEQGWKNILKLQDIAVRENFYYRPIIKFEQILQHSEGLIILSACSLGLIPQLIEQGRDEEAENVLLKLKEVFKDDFYAEIQPQIININQEVMEKLYNLSLKHNIKCVITTDSHYPLKTDKKYHDAVKAISLKKKYGEAGFSDDCFYLMQDKDLEERINKSCLWMKDLYKEFMKNTYEIADKCEFKIEKGKDRDTLPKFSFESSKESDSEYLKDLFKEFEEWKQIALEKPEECLLLTYHKRVDHE